MQNFTTSAAVKCTSCTDLGFLYSYHIFSKDQLWRDSGQGAVAAASTNVLHPASWTTPNKNPATQWWKGKDRRRDVFSVSVTQMTQRFQQTPPPPPKKTPLSHPVLRPHWKHTSWRVQKRYASALQTDTSMMCLVSVARKKKEYGIWERSISPQSTRDWTVHKKKSSMDMVPLFARYQSLTLTALIWQLWVSEL